MNASPLSFSRRRLLVTTSALAAVPWLSTTRIAIASTPVGAPALEIVSPAAGENVTSADISIELSVENFQLSAEKFGAADESGVGHILVFIDGATIAQLTNFYVQTSIVVSGVGIEAGSHTLTVVLASNTHVPDMATAQAVDFTFAPASPVEMPTPEDAGAPTLDLLSSMDGDSVESSFSVELDVTNFHATDDLEGKANVAGYGHFHVLIDLGQSGHASHDATPDPNAAPSLAGLVLMPGETSFDLDLSAWGVGEHTVLIVAAQNDHSPIADVEPVTFKVNVS